MRRVPIAAKEEKNRRGKHSKPWLPGKVFWGNIYQPGMRSIGAGMIGRLGLANFPVCAYLSYPTTTV